MALYLPFHSTVESDLDPSRIHKGGMGRGVGGRVGTAPRSLGGRAKQVGKHFGSSALVSLKGSLEFGGFSFAVMGYMLATGRTADKN